MNGVAKRENFDYIIVGAGSAGCVLANRLSADQSVRVLLLEAGGGDAHPYVSIPLGLGMLQKKRMFDWGYTSEVNAEVGGRKLFAPRGKLLGGSSSINNMVFTRGHPGDYDRWARNGATGWAFADVLPFFKRIETWEGGESAFRGGTGPVGVRFSRATDPVFTAIMEAACTAGYPKTDDYNGEHAEGFGRSQYSISNGRRASSSAAFLRPAITRSNLSVRTRSRAQQILFDGTRAVGITYEREGASHDVFAAREVLLCGGAFNSPQLLMLSGIGPADHLNSIGLKVRADLPVGSNLQDHVAVQVRWHRRSPGPFFYDLRLDRIARSMLQAYLLGTGPATYLPSGMKAFLKTDESLAVPDLEYMFRAAPPEAGPWFPGIIPAYRDSYSFTPVVLHPKSRGTVRLRSANPNDPVAISYGLLTDKDDLRALRAGIRRARDLNREAALDGFRGDERSPGSSLETDNDLDEWIRETLITISHPSCTCRMGTDGGAVLDPELRVRGVEALRVIDASAFPDLPGAHINASVMMLAEKAAHGIVHANEPLESLPTY